MVHINNRFKGLLFDLDNTLLDRSLTFHNFAKTFIARYFPQLADEDERYFLRRIIEVDADGYKDRRQMFLELLDLLPWSRKPDLPELLAFYQVEYLNNAVLMDGALQVLQHFKPDCKLGLITNGKTDMQHGKITKLKLRPYFDAIVVSEEAGVKKPDRRIFALALEKLGLKPGECLYIGDHPVNDVEGAVQAGIQAVWMEVNQPWKPEIAAKPLATIRKLSELIVFLARID